MKWFNDLKIGTKLLIGFSTLIFLFLIVSVFALYEITALSEIQDAGAKRADDAITLHEIQIEVGEVYTHIAGAIINRNVSDSKTHATNDKEKMGKNITLLFELVDTDEEKAEAKVIEEKYKEYISLFADKVIPLVETDTDEAKLELTILDGKIDDMRSTLLASLKR